MSARTFFAAATVAVLAACGGSDGPVGPGGNNGTNPKPNPTASASVEAGASSNVFTPASVDILAGGTVTWNFGARQHDVNFGGVTGAPANIPVTANAQVSRVFSSKGTFNYDCTLHAGMTGTVRVH